MKDKYLRETRMVDFSNPAIQKLIQNMKWKEMIPFEVPSSWALIRLNDIKLKRFYRTEPSSLSTV